MLLLGADLVKPEDQLLLAYDDPLGVTAAFNKNLLVRINRELQGNFDLDRFAHRAIWNETEQRVEMHLVSERDQVVRVETVGVEVPFVRDEWIWTESSYKYVRIRSSSWERPPASMSSSSGSTPTPGSP